MSGSEPLAALLVGAGFAFLVVGVLGRFRSRTESLAQILDLPYGERDVPVEAVTETHSALLEDTIGLAGRVVSQVDPKGAIKARLEQARVPLRPGELVLVVLSGAAVLGLFTAAITEEALFGVAAAVSTPFLAKVAIDQRIRQRRTAIERGLPEALSIVASSLSAGHTFLRSIQLMTEEAEGPLSEEFERVVAETRLGDSVVDAMERMARRIDLNDLIWIVQAIRIQQEVGGKLADLLHTLADFMRGREELRREIAVLTAEGRISAWVLGGMPVFLLLLMQVLSPGYMDPMFRGWGPVVLAITGLSVLAGVAVIRRMVSSIEV